MYALRSPSASTPPSSTCVTVKWRLAERLSCSVISLPTCSVSSQPESTVSGSAGRPGSPSGTGAGNAATAPSRASSGSSGPPGPPRSTTRGVSHSFAGVSTVPASSRVTRARPTFGPSATAPVRIFGPARSSDTSMSRPTFSAAASTLAIIFRHDSAPSWAQLMRATSIPASAKPSTSSASSAASDGRVTMMRAGTPSRSSPNRRSELASSATSAASSCRMYSSTSVSTSSPTSARSTARAMARRP